MKSNLFGCSLPLLVGSVSSLAAPVPALDSAALVQQADTIVVARVTADRMPAAGGTSRTIELTVERVVKTGALSFMPALRMQLPASATVGSDLQVGSRGLFFANCSANWDCAAVDASHPSLVALDHAGQAYAEGSSTMDKVIAELVGVLLADDSALSAAPAGGVNAAAAFDLRSRAVEALAGMPKASAIAPLLAASRSESIATRMAATAALVRLGEFSSLSLVEPQMLSSLAEWNAARRSVAHGMLAIQSPPSKLIPTMTQWLRAEDVEVRRAAAYALSDIRSRATIAPLMSMALSDADQMVRYYAVSGLATVTGRGQVPSLDAYRVAENRYLEDWKNWGKKSGQR